jgi:hypothetical protein
MRLEPSPHVKRVKVNALLKVVGFLRELRFLPTGKVDRVGKYRSARGRSLMRYGLIAAVKAPLIGKLTVYLGLLSIHNVRITSH